jgi:predicted  nucleic acid-binding Zn-ribbon protein
MKKKVKHNLNIAENPKPTRLNERGIPDKSTDFSDFEINGDIDVIQKIIKDAVEKTIGEKFDSLLSEKLGALLDDVKKQAGINIEELVRRNREMEIQLRRVERRNHELQEYLETVKSSSIVEEIEDPDPDDHTSGSDSPKNITDDGYVRFKARINQLKTARRDLRKEIRKTELETACIKEEITKLRHKQGNLWEQFQQQEKLWEITLNEIGRNRRQWWRGFLGLK